MKGDADAAALAGAILPAIILEVQRDFRGMDICRIEGIGAVRRKLGPSLAGYPKLVGTHDTLSTFLSGMCELCPHTACDMKDWKFTH